MSTIIWKKKNGNELETNDLPATIKYMESIGAKRKGEKKKYPATSVGKTKATQ